MNVTIKSAEIVNSLFLKYSFDQSSLQSNDSLNVNSDAPIHDDLRNAFRQLIPHYTFICEEVKDEELVAAALDRPESYLEDKENAASEVFFNYRVIGFSTKTAKGIELLTINGAKRLTNGDEIYFSTPTLFLESADYTFSENLQTTIGKLKSEVQAYMEGKQAPKAQTEMFAEDDQTGPEEDGI